jgi:hypothetical protein
LEALLELALRPKSVVAPARSTVDVQLHVALEVPPGELRQHSTSRQYVGDHGLTVRTITEPPDSQHQRMVRMYFQ